MGKQFGWVGWVWRRQHLPRLARSTDNDYVKLGRRRSRSLLCDVSWWKHHPPRYERDERALQRAASHRMPPEKVSHVEWRDLRQVLWFHFNRDQEEAPFTWIQGRFPSPSDVDLRPRTFPPVICVSIPTKSLVHRKQRDFDRCRQWCWMHGPIGIRSLHATERQARDLTMLFATWSYFGLSSET